MTKIEWVCHLLCKERGGSIAKKGVGAHLEDCRPLRCLQLPKGSAAGTCNATGHLSLPCCRDGVRCSPPFGLQKGEFPETPCNLPPPESLCQAHGCTIQCRPLGRQIETLPTCWPADTAADSPRHKWWHSHQRLTEGCRCRWGCMFTAKSQQLIFSHSAFSEGCTSTEIKTFCDS